MPTQTPADPDILIDAHEDIAWNARDFGRDFAQSALQTRQLEAGTSIPSVQGMATCGLPEALRGRVGLIFGTIYASPTGSAFAYKYSYTTPAEAHRIGMDQMDVYHRLADEHDAIRLVRDQHELQGVLDSWQPDTDFTAHRLGIVILMEGADPIREPRAFEEWYERGLRIVGPAWGDTRYSAGTLTDLGRELLEVMASFNAVLDLSHMKHDAALEAIDRYPGAIIASHSNPRRFCDIERHLSDDLIRRLAERDGVIGVVPYNNFMYHRGTTPNDKANVPVTRVADMIDHICQVAGSARHVGLGTDFDGGFGAKEIPAEMSTIADLHLITDALAARGYAPADVQAVRSGNFLRILRAALP